MAPEAQPRDRLDHLFYPGLEPVLPLTMPQDILLQALVKPQISLLFPQNTRTSWRFSARFAPPPFSPHHHYNCAIDLPSGTTPPCGWLYSLSGPETKAMEEYIEDSLAAGSIHPSASPAIAGFFFVENKTLRLCNEYQGLNYIAV